ncbi:unnamed protein product [Pleuronectes platessa]|uniref:Uncharacterized protein n=1 Tax=Pleuronectes platessa TaxID=8262 RepID=A0A9N7ZD45_PLEPL|nr:unnamed protein product [Pleuronectes platessa]
MAKDELVTNTVAIHILLIHTPPPPSLPALLAAVAKRQGSVVTEGPFNSFKTKAATNITTGHQTAHSKQDMEGRDVPSKALKHTLLSLFGHSWSDRSTNQWERITSGLTAAASLFRGAASEDGKREMWRRVATNGEEKVAEEYI